MNRIKEPAKLEFLSEQIRKGDTFVDVGACFGYFTFFASDLVLDKGLVIAIEPNDKNANELRDLIDNWHLPNIVLSRFAVSDYEGDGTLYLGQGSGLHTLKPDIRNPIYGKQAVKVFPLDTFLDADGYKIDVEGAELEVLQGGKRVLSNARYIAMDVHPSLGVDVDKVKSMLTNYLGFTLVKKPMQHNELFGVRV